MLSSTDLKSWLHKDLPRLDKLLLVLAALDRASALADIRGKAVEAGFRIPTKWNMSAILGRSRGMAINTPDGWEITDAGKLHLRDLGVSEVSPTAMSVAIDLRKHLAKVTDEETREFVSEAIQCHENRLYRSAVVMSWLGAISILHKHVHANRLADFNAEASRVDSRWRTALTTDDLGKMNEDKFLNTIERLSIIGKNVKESLKECLKRRNGCGHPNSMRVSTNQSAAHIEVLLLHVFKRFS